MYIYLDMDGVLANFDGHCHSIFDGNYHRKLDPRTFWAEVSKPENQDIFKRLDKMPDADDLVNGVVDLVAKHDLADVVRIGVLTAIPKIGRIPEAKQHKKDWLGKHWPWLLQDFNVGPLAEHKQFHARRGDVLIDDSELNIPQWRQAGGHGILHSSAASSLRQLDEYLGNLKV